MEPKDWDGTVPEHQTLSEVKGLLSQKDPVLTPSYHEWLSSKALQGKLPQHLHTPIPPNPSKTLNLVQQARRIRGTLFSVGAFSINKRFLTPPK